MHHKTTTSQDHYPFGMLMPTRTWDAESSYRFGFNGMEKDDEMKGVGNQIHYEFREFDTRICKMISIDPRQKEYPWQSSYAYFSNSPIWKIDFLGGGDDNYNLDENGVLVSIEKTEDLDHHLFVEGEEIILNDPNHDSNILEEFIIGEKVLNTISNKNINYMMSNSGVDSRGKAEGFSGDLKTGLLSFNKYDFTTRYLTSPQGIEATHDETQVEQADKTGQFFRFENNPNLAFNTPDAGNAMWGQAMQRLGYPLPKILYAANINSMVCNSGQPDSQADQRAISFGFNYTVPNGSGYQGAPFLSVPQPIP